VQEGDVTEAVQLVREWNGAEVQLTVTLVDGRFECTRLAFSSREGAPPITTLMLRYLPLHTWVKEGAASTHPQKVVPACHCHKLDCKARLKQVAEIYRSAYLVRYPPKKAVSEALTLSESTAGRLIANARRAGFLSPTMVGRGRP
jgi:hypothetical protein